MKIFITKYAPTQGIYAVEANIERSPMTEREIAVVPSSGLGRPAQIFREPDWHRTKAAAKARANEMRAKKVASLRGQISKLEKLAFS